MGAFGSIRITGRYRIVLLVRHIAQMGTLGGNPCSNRRTSARTNVRRRVVTRYSTDLPVLHVLSSYGGSGGGNRVLAHRRGRHLDASSTTSGRFAAPVGQTSAPRFRRTGRTKTVRPSSSPVRSAGTRVRKRQRCPALRGGRIRRSPVGNPPALSFATERHIGYVPGYLVTLPESSSLRTLA